MWLQGSCPQRFQQDHASPRHWRRGVYRNRQMKTTTTPVPAAPSTRSNGGKWSSSTHPWRSPLPRGVSDSQAIPSWHSPTHTIMSPTHNGMSPRHNGMAQTHNGMTPRHNGMTPTHNGMTPRHNGMTPTHNGVSPRHKRASQGQNGPAPHHNHPPKAYNVPYKPTTKTTPDWVPGASYNVKRTKFTGVITPQP